jgi:hypothetical protein
VESDDPLPGILLDRASCPAVCCDGFRQVDESDLQAAQGERA